MSIILLTRATDADRSKALGYVDQAIAVLEEHGAAKDGGDLVKFQSRSRSWLTHSYGSSTLWTSVSGS